MSARGSDIFYKYKPVEQRTLCAVARKALWYASPSSFNDPIDCHPMFSGEPAPRVVAEAASRFLRKELTPKEEVDYSAWLECVLSTQTEKCGIVSLTERPNNAAMWAHYGDEHRGIALGYEFYTNHEDAVGEPHFYAKPVEYLGRGEVSRNELCELLINRDEQLFQRIFNAVYCFKTPDWSYEEERRLIRLNHYGLTPIGDRLKHIVFGAHIAEGHKRELRRYAPTGVEFYQAIFGPRGLEVEKSIDD